MKNYLNPYSNITTAGSPFPMATIRSSSKLQSSKRGSIQILQEIIDVVLERHTASPALCRENGHAQPSHLKIS
jgi:hypothetical protein